MEISDSTRDIIAELINSGVGRAGKSLNELLEHEVQLSAPVIHILDYAGVQHYLEQQNQTAFVNVIQHFRGGLNGYGVVSFPITKGKTLVNMLLDGGEDHSLEFSVDELEAICEVGNLIINAVQGVISDMVQQEVECCLPSVCICQSMIPAHVLNPDSIYIVGETLLVVEGVDLEGRILLIYAYANLDMLTRLFVDLYETE